MKKLIFLPVIMALLISSCVSSKKQIRKGRYDAAVKTSVRKLHKKPSKEKEILNLDRAFKYANQNDLERINFLRLSGQPEIWEEVFGIYARMKDRQNLVRALPTSVLTAIGFQLINYDNEIVEAKKKAAEFLYAHSLRLLENKDKQSARQAYTELKRVKSLFATYKDVDKYIQESIYMGTSFALFIMKNNTGIPLPPSFERELQKMSLTDLNTMWVKYETIKTSNVNYDYNIVLNIRVIDVSPDALKEVHFEETKKVPDGFEYVLDGNGNVMKDTLGNDIKVPKTKIISCKVIETQQNKAVTISGTLDFINTRTGQVIKTDGITSQYFFEHLSAMANGDIEALKPETKEKLKLRPLPFPNDFEMILGAADIIKDMSSNIIRQNRNLIY